MIDDYRKLVNFVTIMHGALVIDRFKSTKVTQYKRMLRQFSVREITNCHLSANLCHGILQLDELKQWTLPTEKRENIDNIKWKEKQPF